MRVHSIHYFLVRKFQPIKQFVLSGTIIYRVIYLSRSIHIVIPRQMVLYTTKIVHCMDYRLKYSCDVLELENVEYRRSRIYQCRYIFIYTEHLPISNKKKSMKKIGVWKDVRHVITFHLTPIRL